MRRAPLALVTQRTECLVPNQLVRGSNPLRGVLCYNTLMKYSPAKIIFAHCLVVLPFVAMLAIYPPALVAAGGLLAGIGLVLAMGWAGATVIDYWESRR